MKVVLLASAASIHTIQWANGLADCGVKVHLISQQPLSGVLREDIVYQEFPDMGVFGYFFMVRGVRRLLKKIRPDIVNAHYASGYGTTAMLVDYHPWILSVWGSDVYDFPYKSPFHKFLIQKNIMAADAVASTSHCMAQQTRSIAPHVGAIDVTPFGVNVAAYHNVSRFDLPRSSSVVVGTVKTMAHQYGIDILIRAFALLRAKMVTTDLVLASSLCLRVVGGGPQLLNLKKLALDLNIQDSVVFVDRVPHSEVPRELAGFDIFVALSRRESFGVAVIEAGAAGLPVVVSNVGGLPEVTVDGVTGIVVQGENPQAAADALEKLLLDPSLRERMGLAAHNHVLNNYNWGICVEKMLKVYDKTLLEFRS